VTPIDPDTRGASSLERIRAVACLVAGALLVAAGGARAQSTAGSIAGAVRDSTGAPISMVEVGIAGTALRTTTDGTGAFRLSAVPAGTHTIRARRLGFRAVDRTVTVTDSATAPLSITLAALARELDPVVVQAALDRRARYLAGFYERRRMGIGKFITQDRLDAHTGTLPQMLAAELPGVRVVSNRTVNQGIRLRGNSCPPLLWLDGSPAPAAEFDLSTLPLSSLSAIEIYYGPSTVPGEFQLSRGQHACGVVVAWSRMYEGPPRVKKQKKSAQLDSAIASLRVYSADEVEQPARVDSAKIRSPAYPDSLYAFRVEGEVLAEFVIDTTGEVRDGSVGIVSATHRLFADAVERALFASKFEPARHQGRKVPQVMILPFRFQLNRVDDR